MTGLDDILGGFPLTPAADLDRSALQQRLTLKFLLPTAGLADLVQELVTQYTLSPAADRRSASYRTLHFDTRDLAFFHAHRRGCRRREKVRIRHYDDRKLSFFEVKQRFTDLKTVKWRRPHSFGDNALYAEDFELVHRYTRAEGALIPQVWTLFQRLTLVNSLENERVTFDVDLRFSDGQREIEVPHAVIAEVKQSRLNRRTPILSALRHRGFRPQRFSKYCAAIVATHAAIRRNRLTPQFRAMEHIEHGP